LASGKVNCWGWNGDDYYNPGGEGQLGTKVAGVYFPSDYYSPSYTRYQSTVPVEVGSIATATQVSAGIEHSCAVLSSGKVNCWGSNGYGQLGNDSNVSGPTPVEVKGITTATQVSAGGFFPVRC
jgi:alpha-tubulin suppressor-like RCC1 family protein